MTEDIIKDGASAASATKEPLHKVPISDTEIAAFSDTDIEVLYADQETRVSLAAVDVQKASSLPTATITPVYGGNTGSTDLLERPYNFETLYSKFENSTYLRPNVEAYVTNIDSFGHHFLPSVDLASDTAKRRIEDSLLYGRLLDQPMGEELIEPTEEEVETQLQQLRRRARIEYMRLRAFFSYACPKSSFVALRRKLRQDLEVTGNAWFEIIRDNAGHLRRLYYVNVLGMYIADPASYPEYYEPVKVRVNVQHTDIIWRAEDEPRTFTLFVQLHGNAASRPRTYYKEFGDPRVISRDTGVIYKTVNALKKEEPSSAPATEVIHLKIFTARSEYGIHRWSGSIPSVLGSIELDNVNYEFFDNNTVPPLALLVAGGRLGAEAAKRIEKMIEERIKGRKGVNRILIIEARGHKAAGEPGPVPTPKLQFIPLRHVQQTDALFQNYDERNESKIAGCFRQPRILRGIDTEINRATAMIAFRLAEEQVFEPEREAFDEVMNRQLLPAMNILFWLFRSNAPIIRDPDALTDMVERLSKVGVLLPREARALLEDIFNREFTDIQEEWTNMPLPLVLAQGMEPSIKKPEQSVNQFTPVKRPVLESTVNGTIPDIPLPVTAPLNSLGGNDDE